MTFNPPQATPPGLVAWHAGLIVVPPRIETDRSMKVKFICYIRWVCPRDATVSSGENFHYSFLHTIYILQHVGHTIGVLFFLAIDKFVLYSQLNPRLRNLITALPIYVHYVAFDPEPRV